MDDYNKLLGLTITDAYRRKTKENEEYDDNDEIILVTDKGKFLVSACYGGYTGNSKVEYPCYVSIQKLEEVFEVKK